MRRTQAHRPALFGLEYELSLVSPSWLKLIKLHQRIFGRADRCRRDVLCKQTNKTSILPSRKNEKTFRPKNCFGRKVCIYCKSTIPLSRNKIKSKAAW